MVSMSSSRRVRCTHHSHLVSFFANRQHACYFDFFFFTFAKMIYITMLLAFKPTQYTTAKKNLHNIIFLLEIHFYFCGLYNYLILPSYLFRCYACIVITIHHLTLFDLLFLIHKK